MTQFPNEKEPHSNWLRPPEQGACPPPTQDPDTSRDGAPAPVPGQSYAPLPFPAPQGLDPYASRDGAPALPGQSHALPPPEGPPPDYGYAQSHPDNYAPKETRLSPPPSNSPYASVPVPDVDAGPSSTSQEGQGGIMVSLGAFFGNKGPPPMWQRQPPGQLSYGAFPPMSLISNDKNLTHGFPELPPPCPSNPHPFATHDVTEEDWKRFLADVKKAASLSPTQRIKSNAIPLVLGMSFVSGLFATFAIEKGMKTKNRHAVGDIVDHWNHYFFGPRRMEVVLCQASERLSGKLGAAPVGPKMRRRSDSSSSSSESRSSSDGRGHELTGRHARRAARRERREAKRARKAERRERKARGETSLPYELFVTSI
ncbi:hypothetical protein HD554DRAFT_2024755 [Boletus coccyginus]|nr:hypothetical protein HD554DRAFT_2024755 [Boletus coccyginus]